MSDYRQLSLDDIPPPAHETHDRQDAHLERVTARIGAAILAYCQHRDTFHMDDLRQHITRVVGPVAPASPDRVLRQLRQAGRIEYVVKSRRDSLYEVLAVGAEAAA